jgi:tRNA nucleotidyltransferase/poly(A) polymerase
LPADKKEHPLAADPYAGRWVARLRGQVVGQGGTAHQALQAAKAARFKEAPQVEYMASSQVPQLPAIVERLRVALPKDQEVYLVGGAVRDILLGLPPHDFDLAVAGKAIPLARKVANQLKADFYPLDPNRDVGRVLLRDEGDKRLTLDFITLQGADIDADLAARDLTMNAMAIDLRRPDALLDPLGGAADLLSKTVRACGPDSFAADPVRVLRAVRMAATFDMKIEKETRQRMRAAAKGLVKVSPERLRDEIFRLLLAHKPATSLRALDLLGAVAFVFPELVKLKGIAQSAPHAFNVWEHTLQVVDKLEFVFHALDEHYPVEGAADLVSGLIVLRLGRYRSQISRLLAEELVPERQRRALLLFAALFHDSGKALTRSIEEGGRIRFIDHETRSAEIMQTHAAALHLSTSEIDYLRAVVKHHGRPFLLTKEGGLPSRRAIYRFYRDAGAAGVDICLLSLADSLGKYGAQVPEQDLVQHLDTLRALLRAYYEEPQKSVFPPVLLNGDELMAELGLSPGPRVGELLEALREAQAVGDVTDRSQALAFAKAQLNR